MNEVEFNSIIKEEKDRWINCRAVSIGKDNLLPKDKIKSDIRVNLEIDFKIESLVSISL